MKKNLFLILAGILFLAISVLMPSCKEEIYTDEEALAAMKEGLQYKNDLAKELAALNLTNQLQIMNLQYQIDLKKMRAQDSLNRIGLKTVLSIQVQDVTGLTADMSGFSVTLNQSGVAKTLTTDANGFVLFPDVITGTAAVIAIKTGFVRTSGIVSITNTSMQTRQQAVLIPVFPTESATAKISGTLTAQLDVTTEEKEILKDAIVSLNFNNINDILSNPNSNISAYYGLVGVVFDGGFMQTVKTAADGKYEFKVPKTKNPINYRFSVATIQKKQKLLFGDIPNKLDTMRLDSLMTFFGYNANSTSPARDNLGFYYDFDSYFTGWQGLNITIGGPSGGNAPTSPATINWAHMDSTLVTWSFTKFAFGDGSSEFTKVTQTPVFDYTPTNKNRVQVATPAAAVINIDANGKVISLNMTNGGVYKEYGRWYGTNGNIGPKQANGTTFKFLEQLSAEGNPNFKIAIARVQPAVINQGIVKIPFILDSLVNPQSKIGKGYTAAPNAEVRFHINTPPEPLNYADSIYTVNTDLKVKLNGTGVAIDTLYADGKGVLPKLKATNQIYLYSNPVISTYRKNGTLGLSSGSPYSVTATPSNTYKVELLNGFKIIDGGLGYKAAPKVRVQNYAQKQGTMGSWTLQTIAEAATTIDTDGRITAVADPIMTDNLMIQSDDYGTFFYPTYSYQVSIPAGIVGQQQAYARALVDMYGTIKEVLLYNTDLNAYYGNYGWSSDNYLNNYYNDGFTNKLIYASGKGYLTEPIVKVNPVGLTSVEKPAILKAVVNSEGIISNIIIVDGGKGYTVKNDPKAVLAPDNAVNYIYMNGSSDVVYDIDLGSGFHGKAITIFD